MTVKKKVTARTKRVKPIPTGFRTVTPYLTINGAVKALDFYKRAFGARELTRRAMPNGKILHARIKIGDSIIMLADEFPGSDVKSPKTLGGTTFTLHVYSNNIDKFWKRAVSAGAKVAMPLDNQFWGERYGQLDDPFGHRWSLSQQISMSRREMEKKRKAAMAVFEQGEQSSKSS